MGLDTSKLCFNIFNSYSISLMCKLGTDRNWAETRRGISWIFINSGQNYEKRTKPKRCCKMVNTNPFETAFSPINSLECVLLIGSSAVSNEVFSTILWTVFVPMLAEIRPEKMISAEKYRNSAKSLFLQHF